MNSHGEMVEGLSEDALSGAITDLSRNRLSYQDGTWESERFAELKAERTRRNRKRRGKGEG